MSRRRWRVRCSTATPIASAARSAATWTVVPAVTVGARLEAAGSCRSAPRPSRAVSWCASRASRRTAVHGPVRAHRCRRAGRSTPAERARSRCRAGERAAATFTVTPPSPAPPGTSEHRRARRTVGGDAPTRAMCRPSPTRTSRRTGSTRRRRRACRCSTSKVAPVTVGYIMGSGDQVPDAHRAAGPRRHAHRRRGARAPATSPASTRSSSACARPRRGLTSWRTTAGCGSTWRAAAR